MEDIIVDIQDIREEFDNYAQTAEKERNDDKENLQNVRFLFKLTHFVV